MARKITISSSDAHFGDVAQMLLSWRDTHEKAIARAARFEPDVIDVVINGDLTAGKGIFRGQENRVVLQNANHQALWAAWELAPYYHRLTEIAPTTLKILWGNHDDNESIDIADYLVDQLALLGVPAEYYPVFAMGNFAAKERDGAWWHASHGFGHSDYYARTYTDIRDLWRLHAEFNRTEGIYINRFLRAHSHLLSLYDPILPDCFSDTTGGWHVQTRWNIGRAVRDTGLILYLDDGVETLAIPEFADRKLVMKESRDPDLYTRNRAAAAKAVGKALSWKREQRAPKPKPRTKKKKKGKS